MIVYEDIVSDDRFIELFELSHGKLAVSDEDKSTREYLQFCYTVINNIIKYWDYDSATTDPIGNISYGILYDFAFNACAKKRGDLEAIAINVGALIKIRDVFLTLMSTSHLFPEQEGADLEYVENNLAKEKICMVEEGGFYPSDPPIPKSKFRMIKAFDYSYFSILILTYHEIGHLTAGHLDFIENDFSMNTLDEKQRNIDSKAKISTETLYALEFEADKIAAEQSLFYVLTYNDPVMSKLTLEERLTGFLTGAYALFLIFDLYHAPDIAGGHLSTHPDPYTRVTNFFLCCVEQLKLSLPDKVDFFKQAHFRVLSELSKTWVRLDIPRSSIVKSDNSDNVHNEIVKIRLDAQKLRENWLFKYTDQRNARAQKLIQNTKDFLHYTSLSNAPEPGTISD